MADWTELPVEVLNKIVLKFETLENLVYFSAVCRPWNKFVTKAKHKFNVKTMPWLLLTEPETTAEENPDCLRKLYNPYNNRYFEIMLPETLDCRCWGSVHGWIVTYNFYLDLHMFNPLTRDRMALPLMTSLPYQWGRYYPYPYDGTFDKMKADFIYKAFVIKAAEDDFIVFVSYYFEKKLLAFARPGDESWTSIDQPGNTSTDKGGCATEVVLCGTRILILNEDASLGFLDISDLSDPQKLVVKDYLPECPMVLSDRRNLGIKVTDYLPPPPEIVEGFDTDMYGLYLVKSGDDIFMVLRDRCNVTDDNFVYGTFRFLVYRLDLDNRKWSEVHDLGDVSLFLGNCSSMSVSTIGSGQCKSNCIYYNDDYNDGWEKPITLGGEDMGIYTIEDGEPDHIDKGCYTYSKSPILDQGGGHSLLVSFPITFYV